MSLSKLEKKLKISEKESKNQNPKKQHNQPQQQQQSSKQSSAKFKFPPAAPKPKNPAGPKLINMPLPKGTRGHLKKNKILKEINAEHLHDVDFDEILKEVAPGSLEKGSKLHHYMSPEQFVNANYKFVVNPASVVTGPIDLKEIFYTENANKVLEWNAIELVLCPLQDKYDCPICNEKEIVAPKITKCGHIFCFPCILQYLNHRQFYHSC